MKYQDMLKKLTEDAINWIITNASISNLQSDIGFKHKIAQLKLWDEEGSVKPIIDSKIEQNPLGKPRTDLTLAKAPSTNSSQYDVDVNDPFNNISRETKPLDDRCNLQEDIHFCMLAEHYQTCRIFWVI
jgi:hypothetical protein